MSIKNKYDIVIVGGGLAGLTTALHLSKSNLNILLIEKQAYPHHKVCGEYVSNEVIPYLNSLGLDPLSEGAVNISNFEISNHKGHSVSVSLPLGGFGMSRYALDLLLYNKAKQSIDIVHATVDSVKFSDDIFTITTLENELYLANYVIGAYGKRSNLDKSLEREFIQKKSSWLAVKAHYEYDMPSDLVALHNFDGGYCGISKIENGLVNACYLTTYSSFKKYGNIKDFQKQVMTQNPKLKHFFENATMRFEKPLSISQISFEKKESIKNHVIMLGDSAGLIHPLCGNGMAMAIHSAKLFSEIFLKHYTPKTLNRSLIEKTYTAKWSQTFDNRLQTGRRIQNLLLHSNTTRFLFPIAKTFPTLVKSIVKRTHGKSLLVND